MKPHQPPRTFRPAAALDRHRFARAMAKHEQGKWHHCDKDIEELERSRRAHELRKKHPAGKK